jgi:hypothetical protein
MKKNNNSERERERKRVSSKIKAREMLISHVYHRELRIFAAEFCHLAV